eukprot:446405_1
MPVTLHKVLELVTKFYVKQNKAQRVLTITTGLAVGLITINYLFKRIYRKIKNYPPGPIGLPIFGCAVPFAINRDQFLKSLPTYGELTFLNVGAQNICVINSSRLFKQIMSSKYTLDRPPVPKWIKLPHFGTVNERWKKRRQLAMKSLINEINSGWMDNAIPHILINFTFEDVEACINENKLFYPRENMTLLAFSSLYYNATGTTLNKNDNSVALCQKTSYWAQQYLYRYEQMVRATFFPYLSSIFYLTGFVQRFIETESKIKAIGEELFNKRQKVKTEKSESDEKESFISIIDVFNENHHIFDKNKNEMLADLMILFLGGTDTTQVLSERALIFAGQYPKIQEEIFNELKICLNSNNGQLINNKYYSFSLKWIKNCPKYRAFVHECARLSNLTAIAVPHIVNNTEGIIVNGLNIPNKTIVIGNFQHISGFTNNEINQFENFIKPINKFNLQNWLTKNDQFKKNDSVILFSYGKRDCMGQSLAIKHLYLVIATIILNFKIILPDKTVIDNIKYTQGTTNQIINPIGVK